MANIVSATRNELNRLKEQVLVAKRGHRLLKDKQDEMIRNFMEIFNHYNHLKKKVEFSLKETFDSYHRALTNSNQEELFEKTLGMASNAQILFEKVSLMSVLVPKIVYEKRQAHFSYSMIDSDPNLDDSLSSLGETFNDLLLLVELDKTIQLLLNEIKKTRRRVNAIEHLMIPELEGNLKEVRSKLSDIERANTIRTMKSKEIITKTRNKEND